MTEAICGWGRLAAPGVKLISYKIVAFGNIRNSLWMGWHPPLGARRDYRHASFGDIRSSLWMGRLGLQRARNDLETPCQVIFEAAWGWVWFPPGELQHGCEYSPFVNIRSSLWMATVSPYGS